MDAQTDAQLLQAYAERRSDAAFAELVRQVAARDRQDEQRPIDPLRKAPDAVVIDTSNLSQNEVLTRMVEVVDRWRSLD